jgi:hypothetical protein
MSWRDWITQGYAARPAELRPVFRNGASLDRIERLESELGLRLPRPLRELLLESDGVDEFMQLQGEWMNIYTHVWSCDEIAAKNRSIRADLKGPTTAPREAGTTLLFFADAAVDGILFALFVEGAGVAEPAIQAYYPIGHAWQQVARLRDPARAARLHAALDRVRAEAEAGEVLTFERLASWQSIVLGTAEARFRTLPAFAKEGRERYGLDDRTEPRFRTWLREADDEDATVAARAARIYLDVLFTHPFDDGNGRAAALALDFVLARAGVVLDQVGPLLLVRRHAGDGQGVLALVRLLEILIKATRRRAATG